MPPFIYLASQSPRRQSLLSQMGQGFVLLLPDPSEDVESLESTQARESPLDYVKRVTALKLRAALNRWRLRGLSLAPILCADTTVALGSDILGKPQDDDDAFQMLSSMSGRWHEVHTGIAVATADGVNVDISTTKVEMAPLSDQTILAYIATGEPLDKAGAYGIQGFAGTLIKRIEGSYTGVMGLPVFETAQLLSQVGIRIL
jgi:septum formation protein